MPSHRFNTGDTVLVDGWGLAGFPLRVDRRKRGGHYSLTFAHNGNRVPGFYHDALVKAA